MPCFFEGIDWRLLCHHVDGAPSGTLLPFFFILVNFFVDVKIKANKSSISSL